MTQVIGLAATTLHTALPDAPKSPEAGSIGVCIQGTGLCIAIFADHGAQQIVARLGPAQADYFCGLLADCMREITPTDPALVDRALENWGTLQ